MRDVHGFKMMRRMVPNWLSVVFSFFRGLVYDSRSFGWCAFPASQLIINDAGGFLFFFFDLFSFGFLRSIFMTPAESRGSSVTYKPTLPVHLYTLPGLRHGSTKKRS
jgi:hypothetical protein